jgi:hypothetical protein
VKNITKIMEIERGDQVKGSDIKVYLVKNGLKQSHIAKKAGIPEPIFCMMLNDKRRIEVNEYMRICDALGVPLEQFKPRMPDKKIEGRN